MRKLISLIAALAILATLAPTSAFAGSIGACGSSGTNLYRSGELYGPGQFYGVYGEAQVNGSSYFGPCSPDDNSGINASGVQIGIAEGNDSAVSFVTLGIIICNSGDSSWPSTLCNGARHFYAEQHGAFFWDYTMWDLGYADLTQHDLQISYGICGYSTQYCWYVDGILKKHFDMGSGFVPWNSTAKVSWQVETKDSGDGLGDVSHQVTMGGMASYFNGAWHDHKVGTGCDTIDAQHRCLANGTYGFYAYTVN